MVFITGASSGIGAAAVPVFAAAGYDVVLAARRRERLERVAAETRANFPAAQLLPVVCDVASSSSVQAAFRTVEERFGRLDALINNAGFGVYGRVEQTPLDTFRASLETNFLGAVRCTQAALPLLRRAVQAPVGKKRRWGAFLVLVSSFAGRRALPQMSAYCASKFALEALGEALRLELHDDGIAVSVVNPGVTRTEFFTAASGARPDNFISPLSGMAPEAVAGALLRAARRPCRQCYLTLAGQSGMVLQGLAPWVLDYILLQTLRQAGAKAKKPDARGES